MKSWDIVLAHMVAASLAIACGSRVSEGDSETHWVACKKTEDCSGAQICEAKRCVEPSVADGGSAGPSALDGRQSQDADWTCLQQPRPPQTDAEFARDFVLKDVISGAPMANAEGRLCEQADVDCLNPVSDTVSSDSSGHLTLVVPTNFVGFALFTTESSWPTSFEFNGATFPPPGEQTIPFANAATVAALGNTIQARQELGNAVVLATVHDCTGKLARDVSFEPASAAGTGTPFYSAGGIASSTATGTDESGYGGLVNVPPGVMVVQAALSDGTRRVVTTAYCTVRPNSLAVIDLAPPGW